jgi:hypothetical protein
MWFALGIVSLTSFFAYRLWRKYYWAWGWTDDQGYLRHGKRRYKTRHGENKDSHRFGYAVTVPPGLYFRIKRESRWDRWAKALRLSVEYQLDDPEFDASLYLVSDDPAWCAELARVPELRRVVKALFQDRNFRGLTCEGRHLSADLQVQGKEAAATYLYGEASKNIVAALFGIADRLAALSAQHGSRRRDPYALRAIVLVSLASAVLMLGGLELFRIFWLERGQVMIDGTGLLAFSSLVAGALLGLLLVSAAAWLRGSSHAHVVMWEILISGGLGLVMSSYALARDVNCDWDQAIAASHAVTVVGKYTGHRRKYGTYYKLNFDADAARAGLPASIEVDAGSYRKAVVGERMVILVKPGRLGYRWIEAIVHP